MVDVRVGENHRAQLLDVESKRLPVQHFERARALIKTAVDQYRGVAIGNLHA